MSNQGLTTQLKRVLTFKDLFLNCVCWIIGAGVMTMLPAGIGLTGRSIPIAFIIATVIMVLLPLPMCFIAGTVRLRGGTYTIMSMLGGKTLTGITSIVLTLQNITFVTLGLSFASYWISLFGWGNEKVIAVIILTLFYVLNLFGIDKFAKVQNLIVAILVIALAAYIACGVGHVDPDYFNTASAQWMTGGMSGLLQAGALMTYCLGGATGAFMLSGQAKNPTRDVPLSVILSTLSVAVLYAIIGIITAGVLPVEQVANQNLAVIAEVIMSRPLYVAFIICGAGFAICSTLNAKFAAAMPNILQAIDDGWFPKGLGKLNRFKAPWVLLTILWALGVVCIVGDLSLSAAGSMSLILGSFISIFLNIMTIRLPKVCPEAWAKSRFHCSQPVLVLVSVLGAAAATFNVVMNMSTLDTKALILNIAFLVVTLVYALWRGKKVEIIPSYEAD
ncbi:MAG: APC family permease [Butyricicoccus sp.]|nr:APC family permease [Butyricicoccus sp.]